MSATTGFAASVRERVRDKLPDFLLAEYSLTVDSLLQNEDSGEKRATFFVTLAGVVGGGFALASGQNSLIPRDHAPLAAAVTAAVLLVLGIMTTRRIIERHKVTDEYIFALRQLRRQFVTQSEAAEMPGAFFKLYEPREPRSFQVFSIGKGGWLESVAFVNAVLAGIVTGGTMFWWKPDVNWLWPLGTLAAIAGVWAAQKTYAHRLLEKKQCELRRTDSDHMRALCDPRNTVGGVGAGR